MSFNIALKTQNSTKQSAIQLKLLQSKSIILKPEGFPVKKL